MGDEPKIEGLVTDAEEGMNIGYRRPTFDDEAEEVSPTESKQPDEETEEGEEVFEEEEEEPGEDEVEEEEDFLVENVSPDLEEERKNLQRVYFSKLKELAGVRTKAALVDRIEKDPQGMLTMLARRFNVPIGGTAQESSAEVEAPKFSAKRLPEPKEGEQMGEYIQRALSEQLSDLPGFIQQSITHAVKGMQTRSAGAEPSRPAATGESAVQGVIGYLDSTHPDWPMYEKEMIELVEQHPTYASKPDLLYKQAKLNHSAGSTKVAKTAKKASKRKSVARSKTKVKTSMKPKGKPTFDQAWDAAKKELLQKSTGR